jgi:hypothetical protein
MVPGWQGLAGLGLARRGRHGTAWQGVARRGMARQAWAVFDNHIQEVYHVN